ncbi:hypothetical protein Salat_0594400 [Sesamum alatum]|uniref:Uncharacterized protein n=1 Tax=Sesamum alatum TaxID=300844 RepID=A0AAE2CTT6_9LAMI|nr:hypothetical protein Salat_0594400 [Sesamum alatum]
MFCGLKCCRRRLETRPDRLVPRNSASSSRQNLGQQLNLFVQQVAWQNLALQHQLDTDEKEGTSKTNIPPLAAKKTDRRRLKKPCKPKAPHGVQQVSSCSPNTMKNYPAAAAGTLRKAKHKN